MSDLSQSEVLGRPKLGHYFTRGGTLFFCRVDGDDGLTLEAINGRTSATVAGFGPAWTADAVEEYAEDYARTSLAEAINGYIRKGFRAAAAFVVAGALLLGGHVQPPVAASVAWSGDTRGSAVWALKGNKPDKPEKPEPGPRPEPQDLPCEPTPTARPECGKR